MEDFGISFFFLKKKKSFKNSRGIILLVALCKQI